MVRVARDSDKEVRWPKARDHRHRVQEQHSHGAARATLRTWAHYALADPVEVDAVNHSLGQCAWLGIGSGLGCEVRVRIRIGIRRQG